MCHCVDFVWHCNFQRREEEEGLSSSLCPVKKVCVSPLLDRNGSFLSHQRAALPPSNQLSPGKKAEKEGFSKHSKQKEILSIQRRSQ